MSLPSFRDLAAAQGFPVEDVERWSALARPCARLAPDGDGPVVGRFGGPLLLPADVPDPAHPYVATLDFSALPAGVTDLPLPADGHLLLFAFPEDDSCDSDVGSAVYVPAGAAVSERDKHFSWWSTEDEYRELIDRFPQSPLRATPGVSLPRFCEIDFSDSPWEHSELVPFSEELLELWRSTRTGIDIWGTLQLGGYAAEEVTDSGDPLESVVAGALRAAGNGKADGVVSKDVADWVLLADWHTDIEGWEGATVHWAIQREDLAARRFDRVFTDRYWNP